MTDLAFQKVQFVTIDPDLEGQRIDNYLRTFLKGVPKSLIYRILRKGEVRVNKNGLSPKINYKPTMSCGYRLCEYPNPPIYLPQS